MGGKKFDSLVGCVEFFEKIDGLYKVGDAKMPRKLKEGDQIFDNIFNTKEGCLTVRGRICGKN